MSKFTELRNTSGVLLINTSKIEKVEISSCSDSTNHLWVEIQFEGRKEHEATEVKVHRDIWYSFECKLLNKE